jgi:hypothetical protein
MRCKYCGREMTDKEYGYWTITNKEFAKDGNAYLSYCNVGEVPHESSESEYVREILNQYEA